MGEVTLSSKFQVVIPKLLRQELNLKAGQKLQIINYDNRIELIPVENIKSKRGFLSGINTEIRRDERY